MKSFQLIFILACFSWTSAFFLHNNSKKLDKTDDLVTTKRQGSGCHCDHYTCGCCDDVNWLKAVGKLCTNISYLVDDYGFTLTITWNEYVLYNETISAKNPPPLCMDIPELEKLGEICVRFYDLSFAKTHFHGCMEIEVVIIHVAHKTVRIGCMDLPKKIPSRNNIFANSSSTQKNSSLLHDQQEDENNLNNKNPPSVILIV